MHEYWFVFDGCVCVVPRLGRYFQTNRRSVTFTWEKGAITAPMRWNRGQLPHDTLPPTQNTLWSCGVYRSLLLAGNYGSSDHHHHSLFSPIFFVKVLRRYWQLPSLCWSCCDCLSEDQREVFKFDNVLSTRPANTSSNLLLLSKPTWKLEQKLTFFSTSLACIFSPKTQVLSYSNIKLFNWVSIMNRQKITCFQNAGGCH